MVFLLFLVQWLLFFSYKEIRVMDMQWIVTVMFVLFWINLTGFPDL